MIGRDDLARNRATQRLLTSKEELESIEKRTKEAITWYEEVIWEEEERSRRSSEETKKETIKKSKSNDRLLMEIRNWARGNEKSRERMRKRQEGSTSIRRKRRQMEGKLSGEQTTHQAAKMKGGNLRGERNEK